MLSVRIRSYISKCCIIIGVVAIVALIYADSSGLFSFADEPTTNIAESTTVTANLSTGVYESSIGGEPESVSAATDYVSEVTAETLSTPQITMNSTESTTLPSVTSVTTTQPVNSEYTPVSGAVGERWYVTVVDRTRRVSSSYSPKLKSILASEGYTAKLEERVAPYYEEMYYAAKDEGIILKPYSAYRSYTRQSNNYKNRISLWQSKGYSRSEAIEKTCEVILPPGASEHNLGLAVDINGTDYDFDETEAYAWLSENAYKYGFILRYTNEKRDITGVVGEPWHWRFVGVETAAAMQGSGLCLEEYLKLSGYTY